jgi:predicted dehydrogenase
MKLENGVTAVLYATTAYSENSDVFIEILTEKGKLRLEGEKLFVFDENKNMTEIHCDSEIVYHGESYWGSGHSALINDFYDCVRSGKKFEIDAFEGGHAAKIVAASYLSAQKNQAVTIDL